MVLKKLTLQERCLRELHEANAKELLLEATRTTLVSQSRSVGHYKDQSRGKNRFERKKYSKVANVVKNYNEIDMNKLFKQDILQLNIPVVGESDNYMVTIKLEGVIAEIQKNVKNNKNKMEYRTIIQSLTKVFNTTDVWVKCTCADYKYRFAHWNIIKNVSVDDSSQDPGPGKGIRNPNDDKGRGCKHVLLVLANGDWMMKVASVINNYCHYMSEHKQKAFLKLIFPKIYGCPADEAAENDLVAENTDLETNKDLINIVNEYGKNRGKIKPGTNKNPVAGKKAIEKPEAKSEEENKAADQKTDKEPEKSEPENKETK